MSPMSELTDTVRTVHPPVDVPRNRVPFLSGPFSSPECHGLGGARGSRPRVGGQRREGCGGQSWTVQKRWARAGFKEGRPASGGKQEGPAKELRSGGGQTRRGCGVETESRLPERAARRKRAPASQTWRVRRCRGNESAAQSRVRPLVQGGRASDLAPGALPRPRRQPLPRSLTAPPRCRTRVTTNGTRTSGPERRPVTTYPSSWSSGRRKQVRLAGAPLPAVARVVLLHRQNAAGMADTPLPTPHPAWSPCPTCHEPPLCPHGPRRGPGTAGAGLRDESLNSRC